MKIKLSRLLFGLMACLLLFNVKTHSERFCIDESLTAALTDAVNQLLAQLHKPTAAEELAKAPTMLLFPEKVPDNLSETQEDAFIYYNQTDPRWADYLYGGYDPMSGYGCGPTTMAMLISTLTDQLVTPVEMAEWAADNGYWSYRSGSRHELIMDAAKAFGLEAESLSERNADALRAALSEDSYIVLLQGPGHFAKRGHFIILKEVDQNGDILIADSFNEENNSSSWPPDLLLEELSQRATAGGPIWVISAPNIQAESMVAEP